MFRLEPVKKLSSAMTSWPSASSRSQRKEPRKPAPPVTRVRLVAESIPCASGRCRFRSCNLTAQVHARPSLGFANSSLCQ